MILSKAYAYSIDYLENNNIDEAEFKALTLVCHLANIKNSDFYFNQNAEISRSALDEALTRLSSFVPLQYIIGSWDFYKYQFYVGEGVLIPRPETEELVEHCVSYLKSIKAPVVYDLCSGSGCIGVSIAKDITASTVFCIEKSELAFGYLKRNAQGVANVTPICGDINNDFDLPLADLIVSNPPYINTDVLPNLQKEVQMEPSIALDGGADGLDFYRIINDKWKKYLKPNGVLMLEIGDDQGESIKTVLINFSDIAVLKDLSGNDRMVIAK